MVGIVFGTGLTLGGATALGGAATLGAGYLSSSATKSAANTQAAAADRASALQWKQYQQSRQDQMPWLEAGTKALGTLEGQIEAGPGEFTESPGYKFRLAEAEKAILRNRTATGNVASGSTLKALNEYSQDYASNEYDKFLSRYYDRLKPLQSLARVGQTTSANVGQQGIQTGRAMGSYGVQAGQARASGYENQANVWTDALQGGANALGTYMGRRNPVPMSDQQFYAQPNAF